MQRRRLWRIWKREEGGGRFRAESGEFKEGLGVREGGAAEEGKAKEERREEVGGPC